MSPDRARALTAGLIYFSTHITSVAAVVAYAPLLSDPSTGADGVVLLGALLEILLALGCLGTGVVLLPVLQPHGAALANAYSALRTLEAAVIGAGSLAMIALVSLRGADSGSALGGALVAVHQASFLVGQGLIISVNSIVIGFLLWRSGLVPRAIGGLGMIGGVLVLADNLAQFSGVLDQGDAVTALLAVPVFAFEIWFAGYMVLRGFRSGALARPATERAS